MLPRHADEHPNCENLPFNLALTLLAVFLMSDIRSSSSSLTSEIEKSKSYLHATGLEFRNPLFSNASKKIEVLFRIWDKSQMSFQRFVGSDCKTVL